MGVISYKDCMKIVLKFLGFIWTIAFVSFFVLSLYSGSGGKIPPIAKEYIVSFQHLSEQFLTSYWFSVVFVTGWFGVSYTLGKQSGWQKLAKEYGNNQQKNSVVKFHTGNGYVGKISHNGILRVAGNKSGLYLSVIFPFKFGHKNLFIPWADISVITLESGLFADKTPDVLKKFGKLLTKNEYLNIKFHKFPEQRLMIQSFQELTGLIPNYLER
jgi:hypothetical protein